MGTTLVAGITAIGRRRVRTLFGIEIIRRRMR
jgi:hypothetical protein